jgi:hypothetical protein
LGPIEGLELLEKRKIRSWPCRESIPVTDVIWRKADGQLFKCPDSAHRDVHVGGQ